MRAGPWTGRDATALVAPRSPEGMESTPPPRYVPRGSRSTRPVDEVGRRWDACGQLEPGRIALSRRRALRCSAYTGSTMQSGIARLARQLRWSAYLARQTVGEASFPFGTEETIRR